MVIGSGATVCRPYGLLQSPCVLMFLGKNSWSDPVSKNEGMRGKGLFSDGGLRCDGGRGKD